MFLLGMQNGKRSLLTTSLEQSLIKGTQNQILINGSNQNTISALLGVQQLTLSLPQSIGISSIPQFNNILINKGQNLSSKTPQQLINYYVVRQDRSITLNDGDLISILEDNTQSLINNISFTLNHNTVTPQNISCQGSNVIQSLIQDGYGHTININSVDVRTLFNNNINTSIDYDVTTGIFSFEINDKNLKYDMRIGEDRFRKLNTIQDIDITATPTFQGLILSKNNLVLKHQLNNNIFSLIVQFQGV